MKTPPSTTDLDPHTLVTLLTERWELPPVTLTYLALGFGSHHWCAEATDNPSQRWFVTVDDVNQSIAGSFTQLERSLRTATVLHDRAGIEAVVAPLPDIAGDVVVGIGKAQTSWAVAVYPWLDVEPSSFGAFATSTDRLEAIRLVARLHGATPSVPAEIPRRDAMAIPHRTACDVALDRLGMPWVGGPFAEPARIATRDAEGAVRRAFHAYDRLVEAVRADSASWVITHGEPHPGNLVRCRDTRALVMVDWDTCALAPRERDLWQVFSLEPTEDELAAYREVAGDAPISDDALALYRLWWDLSEVAIYLTWFTQAHEESDDMRTGFDGLRESLEKLSIHA